MSSDNHTIPGHNDDTISTTSESTTCTLAELDHTGWNFDQHELDPNTTRSMYLRAQMRAREEVQDMVQRLREAGAMARAMLVSRGIV